MRKFNVKVTDFNITVEVEETTDGAQISSQVVTTDNNSFEVEETTDGEQISSQVVTTDNNSLNRNENQNILFDTESKQNYPDGCKGNSGKPKKKCKEKTCKHKSRRHICFIVFSIIFAIILISALFILMCLDTDSFMRPEFMNNDNFATIIQTLGLERTNVTRNTWIIIITILSVGIVLFFAYLFLGKARRKFGKWTYRVTETERGAKKLFNFVYFGIILLVIIGIFLVLNMVGLYTFHNIDIPD